MPGFVFSGQKSRWVKTIGPKEEFTGLLQELLSFPNWNTKKENLKKREVRRQQCLLLQAEKREGKK